MIKGFIRREVENVTSETCSENFVRIQKKASQISNKRQKIFLTMKHIRKSKISKLF